MPFNEQARRPGARHANPPRVTLMPVVVAALSVLIAVALLSGWVAWT